MVPQWDRDIGSLKDGLCATPYGENYQDGQEVV